MIWHLYILQSQVKETYYVGVTNDLERRLYFHNHGRQGYTRRWRPWELIFHCPFDTKERALEAEAKVKGWKSRKMIRRLVAGEIDLIRP